MTLRHDQSDYEPIIDSGGISERSPECLTPGKHEKHSQDATYAMTLRLDHHSNDGMTLR